MLLLQKILIGAFILALLASQALLLQWPHIIMVPLTYSTIQQAVDNAKPNTRVYVDARKGPYRESIQITTAGLFVQSLFGRAVVEGRSPSEPVVLIVASDVRIAGFEVRGGSTGVLIKNAHSVRVVDNVVTKNLQGISLNQADQNLLSNNKIINNGSMGVLIHTSSDNDLDGNLISGHPIGGLFFEEDSSGNLVQNNLIEANQTGVRLLSSPQNQFLGNRIRDQRETGLWAENSAAIQIKASDWTGNVVAIHLANSLGAVIQGNTIHGNQCGLVLEGNVNSVMIKQNDWRNNAECALKNLASEPVVATENFWGSRFGPRLAQSLAGGSEPGLGEVVIGNVTVEPWLLTPVHESMGEVF